MHDARQECVVPLRVVLIASLLILYGKHYFLINDVDATTFPEINTCSRHKGLLEESAEAERCNDSVDSLTAAICTVSTTSKKDYVLD